MPNIVIVYHSGYGHTAKQAEAVATGAKATLITIDAQGNIKESDWSLLNTADTLIFGSPTYMGSVSWQFKKFADASSKIWAARTWKDKLFAGFTNSASMNGDKHSTLHYFITLAMQHEGLWISAGIRSSNSKSAKREDINYVGSYAGLMMQTPSDASVDEVNPGDLETAKLFGARVAELTEKFKVK
jgi:NAD(P)H dehydrogenase (quinone)